MQENEVDLWPADLAQEDAHTPVAILRQQAEALAAHTGHKLRARVATLPSGFGLSDYSNWELLKVLTRLLWLTLKPENNLVKLSANSKVFNFS